MIKKYLGKIKHILILFSFPTLVLGCSEAKDTNEMEEKSGETVPGISVSSAPRYRAMGIAENDGDDLTTSEFGDGDIIYISQMGTVADPVFSSTATSNLYTYEWYENEDANWESNEEFNFAPLPPSPPIYWDVVKDYGQVGNSFSLYGMFFPVNQQIRFNVETDQTDLNNFQVSDIMGAYHATSALYTRLRFRFFHLMVYLRVTLYVPTYEISGDETTGYDADALYSAYVVNPMTNFGINWRANRSSDTEAPLVQSATSQTRGNIYMYNHPGGGEEISEIPVSTYYPQGELTTDEVRTYEFSVLFPPQTFTGNILCFQLQTPGQQNADGEAKYVTYYFSASQLTTDNNDFRFTQGTLQHLALYLPRHANETVLVGAEIIDWTNASTGMTVVEQPEEEEED